MSDIAIRADRVTKSYKLYDAPRHRLLDILGFSRAAGAGVRFHHALSEISFEIRRGEKVAIIGRNGAGKSTLLKLVTRVITPTSGVMDVRGETRALLSLGTGFHPEFTGRQNVDAYLSSLGFAGPDLPRMVEDAIAFAEIEDYADQPVKTYSSGMGMRLMFAAATMIRPDLLVIDEVLGVGDAYFQQKSFQHISAICAARQTTLLLVTHDIYNAAQLCDRMIWIDRGRLLIDADPATVLRAYQDSIREQEERRLRAKAMSSGRPDGKAATKRVLLDILSAANRPPPSPLYVGRISLLVRGVQVASAPLGDDAFDPSAAARLVAEGANWGEACQFEGRLARPMKDHGSPFHKVTAAFDIPLRDEDANHLSARIECWSADEFSYHVKVHGELFEGDLGRLAVEPGRWTDTTVQPSPPSGESAGVKAEAATAVPPRSAGASAGAAEVASPPEEEIGAPLAAALEESLPLVRSMSASLNTSGVYGTGDIELRALRALDAEGRERHVFEAGEAVTFALDYRIHRHTMREKVQVVLAFKRDGVTDVLRLFTEAMVFDGETRRDGTLTARCAQLPLGIGRYEITVLCARENYYSEMQTVFFSVNPGVYAATMGMTEIIVEGTNQLYGGTGAVLDAEWAIA